MRDFLAALNARLIAFAFTVALAVLPMLPMLPGAALAQGFTLPDGSAVQGHLKASQAIGLPPPVAVGCTIAANATDMVGTCTASAASGSITFGRTYTAAPSCIVWDQSATSTVSMPVYTVSATAITLTTIISTHVLGYLCLGGISST